MRFPAERGTGGCWAEFEPAAKITVSSLLSINPSGGNLRPGYCGFLDGRRGDRGRSGRAARSPHGDGVPVFPRLPAVPRGGRPWRGWRDGTRRASGRCPALPLHLPAVVILLSQGGGAEAKLQTKSRTPLPRTAPPEQSPSHSPFLQNCIFSSFLGAGGAEGVGEGLRWGPEEGGRSSSSSPSSPSLCRSRALSGYARSRPAL